MRILDKLRQIKAGINPAFICRLYSLVFKTERNAD